MRVFRATAKVIHWRGPSPYFFAVLPVSVGTEIAKVAPALSYGWGAIAATITTQRLEWQTAIFPKDGTYIVPLKKAVREQLAVDAGAVLDFTVDITPK